MKKEKKIALKLKKATNSCGNVFLSPLCLTVKISSNLYFYFMAGVLPISILDEHEAEMDFRTGTYFSILEAAAAKSQRGEL